MESFEKEFFASNRRRLFEMLPDRSAMLLSAASLKTRSWDSHYPYCQDKNFYYMTGYENPSAAILLKKIGNNLSTTMFVIQLTPLQIHWNGYLPSPDEVKDITGIESVLTIDTLNHHIGMALSNIDTLFVDFHPVPPQNPLTDVLQTVAEIRLTNPQVAIGRAHQLMARLREIKVAAEIEKIQKAIDLTHTGINGLVSRIKPGSTEYQLEACFNYELLWRRCHPAFQTIIATGNNATILHYSSLGDTLQKGELVLVDLGAEFCSYSADISRTFPVDGVFSTEHRKLYELVLEANTRTIESVKPGISAATLNETTRNILASGMKKLGYISEEKEIGRYYTHGVAHSLGLDTHDITSGTLTTLQPGMVLTIEPGLYIPEKRTGIRIEDNVLVTTDGYENLSSAIPKDPGELEKWLSKAQSRGCQKAPITQS